MYMNDTTNLLLLSMLVYVRERKNVSVLQILINLILSHKPFCDFWPKSKICNIKAELRLYQQFTNKLKYLPLS